MHGETVKNKYGDHTSVFSFTEKGN